MSLSIWRISHLVLATISSLFLLVAALTGAILSLEPIHEELQTADIDETISIGQLLEVTENSYTEIASLVKEAGGGVRISIFDDSGESSFYINPSTGRKIGEIEKTPEIFSFCRTLHRSLFAGAVGRFLVGLSSVILFFIAFSGLMLVFQKQGGVRYLFRKVIKEQRHKDYHTRLGRVMLLMILVVSGTGSYLFLQRFQLIPPADESEQHKQVSEEKHIEDSPTAIHPFEHYTLADLNEITFPLVDFGEEHYQLKLSDRSITVHHLNGTVSETTLKNKNELFSELMFAWHTGEGLPYWSILLGFTSLSVVYFMYSGVCIFMSRPKTGKRNANPFAISECAVVIAVGSETGNTMHKAQTLHQAILNEKVKSYLVEMNKFEWADSMTTLLVITSTYGLGAPPSNATHFLNKINTISRAKKPIFYSVVGFGSKSYADFCGFAVLVDQHLRENGNLKPLLPLQKVNNQNAVTYENWAKSIGQKISIDLTSFHSQERKKESLLKIQCLEKTFSPNKEDNTFLLKLSAPRKVLKEYESGDLLSYRPEDGIRRYYSLAVCHDRKSLLLSIKKHPNGLASSYFSKLKAGDKVYVSFKRNNDFHFPQDAKKVIMVANGTGIAPFLGMIDNNRNKVPISLYWGGQNNRSYMLYQPVIGRLIQEGKLDGIHTAFSREGDNSYVQHLIEKEMISVMNCLDTQGTLLLCGSLRMQQEVEKLLEKIMGASALAAHKHSGTIRTDCY